MADTSITLTTADYVRLAPLMTGDVKPDGIDLRMVHGTGGSWLARADALRRALQDPGVEGGEASMAAHLRRVPMRGAASAVPMCYLRCAASRTSCRSARL